MTGPLKPSEPTATWGEVSRSPDGTTLLAEWIYPCDSAAVVFVSLDRALGRTREGKARVRLLSSWRGHRIAPTHPRTFLFDPRVLSLDAHPMASNGC